MSQNSVEYEKITVRNYKREGENSEKEDYFIDDDSCNAGYIGNWLWRIRG